MAFRRRRFRRKRRRYGRKKSSVKSQINYALKKYERRHTELKWYEVNTLNIPVGSDGGALYPVSNPSQGDTQNQRSGDMIKPVGIYVGVHILGNLTAGAVYSNCVRMIVFQWKSNSQDLPPTAAYILENLNQITTPISSYNDSYREGFRVIKDKRWTVNSQTKGTSTNNVTYRKYFKLGKLRPIKFETGLTTGLWKIYILFISDTAIGVAPYNDVPHLDYSIRFTYTDS